MAKTAAVLSEDDDDEGEAEGQGAAEQTPVLTPVRTPPIRTVSDKAPAQEFEIIETDEAGKPFDDGGTADSSEASLSEDESGERPLIEADEREDARGNRDHRPRETRQSRRERQREGREKTLRENADLRTRLAAQEAETKRLRDSVTRIEPQLAEFSEGQIQNQLTQADSQLAQADRELTEAKRGLAQAITDNDVEAVNTALDARDRAFISREKIANSKQRLSDAIAARREGKGSDSTSRTSERPSNGDGRSTTSERKAETTEQAQPLSRQAAAFANDFQRDHSWIDVKSDDPNVRRDTARALYLDREVLADGFRPDDEEYWDELEDRMRELLPHRFKKAAGSARTPARSNGSAAPANGNGSRQPAEQRRGPMTAAPSERSTATTKTRVHVSPARKQGLIDAGVLDNAGKIINQQKLNRVLSEYATFDRENGLAKQ